MAGKVGRTTAAAAVSTGGSLISDAKLKQLYATMVQCRLLTERACRLRGKPRSADLYAASMGQEAIATGCAIDLRPEDTIALAAHNSIASLVKGVPLGDIVAQMYARRTAYDQSPNILMPSPTQGTQLSCGDQRGPGQQAEEEGQRSRRFLLIWQQPLLAAGMKRSNWPRTRAYP